jgi:hypothetical protein
MTLSLRPPVRESSENRERLSVQVSEGVMPKYRTVWFVGVCAAAGVGLLAALTAWPPAAVLTFFLLTAVVAAGTAFVTFEGRGKLLWLGAAKVGTATGAALVGVGGLVNVLGGWGIAFVVLVIATCPVVVMRALQLGARRGGDHVPTPTPAPAPAPLRAADEPWMSRSVEAMDDATLCLAWRSSYVALQRACTTKRALGITRRRQVLLDELERRNATGFSAWLASSPRAAGDPSRYLLEEPRARQRPPQG